MPRRARTASSGILDSVENRSQAELKAAYGQALTALRSGRAATAERQLRAIQARAPGDVNSMRLLGIALLVALIMLLSWRGHAKSQVEAAASDALGMQVTVSVTENGPEPGLEVSPEVSP